MSTRLAFRLAAIAFAAVIVLVAALQTRLPARPTPAALPLAQPAAIETRDARLARCQALGEAGARDPECLSAWSDARERFLGGDRKAEH